LKPYSMELAPKTDSFRKAALQNMGAMFAFGFFHSLLARKTVKQWMNLPVCIERSLFCVQGGFFLQMIQHFWLDVEGWSVWDFSSSDPRVIEFVLSLFWFGSAFLLSATFALDHFHLFGLSQGFGMDINKALGLCPPKHEEGGMATRWHYHAVAHPIMTGMFLNLWATPTMTPSRLLCACFLSLYIITAVTRLEERTLRAELGPNYEDYLAKTPRFFPTLEGLSLLLTASSSNATKKMA
ncbi:MAG: hypothetical protein SGILL_009048, partial [Bacillariaceae sp.]